MSKWVLHSLHAKKTLLCTTKPSQQQARSFAVLFLSCALFSVPVPSPALLGTPAVATGADPCPAEVTGRRCLWTFPGVSQVDGVGGTLSFWEKTKEWKSKNYFFNAVFQGKHPTATKEDVWVVSRSLATVPHALIWHVEPISSLGR